VAYYPKAYIGPIVNVKRDVRTGLH